MSGIFPMYPPNFSSLDKVTVKLELKYFCILAQMCSKTKAKGIFYGESHIQMAAY